MEGQPNPSEGRSLPEDALDGIHGQGEEADVFQADVATGAEVESRPYLGEVVIGTLTIPADTPEITPEQELLAAKQAAEHQTESKRNSTEDSERLFTTGEVAKILHVSGETVRGWADRGIINCHRTAGGRRRFPVSELQAIAGSEINEEDDCTLRPCEAATRLGISKTKLRELANDGALGATKTVGGHRRYSYSQVKAVAALLNKKSQKSIETLKELGFGSLLG